MRDTAGEARANSSVTFFHGPQYMVVPLLADHQELTYNSSSLTQNLVCKTCQDKWMIGTDGKMLYSREHNTYTYACGIIMMTQ